MRAIVTGIATKTIAGAAAIGTGIRLAATTMTVGATIVTGGG
jgi:hypothetical protein